MKHHPITLRIAALLCAVWMLAFTFASCSSGGGSGTESTTAAGGAETTKPVEKMDLANEDLSKYISLGQYKGIKLEMDEMDYTIYYRELLLDDGAYFDEITSTDRVVCEGDLINVDYTGYYKGTQFDGGKASAQDLTVSDGRGYIDGFGVGFVGAVVGETSSFNVTFPEQYGDSFLTGKEVTFEFKVNHIYEFDALTDEMAKDLSGGEYVTAEEYETYLRDQLITELLWPQVIENATILEYPTQQVQYYYQQNRNYYEHYANSYDMTYAEFLTYFNLTDADLYESAKLYTAEDLVFHSIRKNEQISLSEDEYDAMIGAYIDDYKAKFGYTDAEIKTVMPAIEENMLYDKVLKTVVGWSEIVWLDKSEDNGADAPAEETTAPAEDGETTADPA
jgi:trigger factor